MVSKKVVKEYEDIGKPIMLGEKGSNLIIRLCLQKTIYTDNSQQIGVHIGTGWEGMNGFTFRKGLVIPPSYKERLGNALIELKMPREEKEEKTTDKEYEEYLAFKKFQQKKGK